MVFQEKKMVLTDHYRSLIEFSDSAFANCLSIND